MELAPITKRNRLLSILPECSDDETDLDEFSDQQGGHIKEYCQKSVMAAASSDEESTFSK